MAGNMQMLVYYFAHKNFFGNLISIYQNILNNILLNMKLIGCKLLFKRVKTKKVIKIKIEKYITNIPN